MRRICTYNNQLCHQDEDVECIECPVYIGFNEYVSEYQEIDEDEDYKTVEDWELIVSDDWEGVI